MAIVKSTFNLNAVDIKPSTLNFTRASNATRVNRLGIVELVGEDVIRHDFDPSLVGQVLGWLIEESSTNNCLQSQDFSTEWSAEGVANTAHINTLKSPDGTLNADELRANATSGIAAVRQATATVTGEKYTVSVWAKKKDLNFLEISNSEDATDRIFAKTFNLSTGESGTASAGTVDGSTMDAYPGGWYRCSVTFTGDVNESQYIYLKARANDQVSTTSTYTVDQGIYLWGAQFENMPYLTSYIPTTTNAVTRAQDQASVSETNGLWNWDVGVTIRCNFTPMNVSEVVAPIYYYHDSGNTNVFAYYSDGSIKIYNNGNSQTSTNGTPSASVSSGFTNTRMWNQHHAMSIEPNRLQIAQQGTISENVTDLPDTSIVVPSNPDSGNYEIKFFSGVGTTTGSGWLKKFSIYPRPSTDGNLSSLSWRMGHTSVEQGGLTPMNLADFSVGSNKLANDSVTAVKIADNAVTLNSIADDSVSNAHIVDGTITGAKIATNAITSAHISADVIIAEDIAANAITIAELQDNAVGENKILDDAVTQSKIASGAVGVSELDLSDGTAGQFLKTDGLGNISFATVDANVSGVLGASVGGDITGTVGNAQIVAGAVGTSEIADQAVNGDKLAMGSDAGGDILYYDGSVSKYKKLGKGTTGQVLKQGTNVPQWDDLTTNIGNTALGGSLGGTIDAATINANSITTSQLASDSVNTINIANGQVTTNKIAAYNVTKDKIAVDAIDGTRVADDAIGSEHIADNAITNAHMADNSIGSTEIQNNSISGLKIQANAIDSDHYVDLSIDQAHIGNLQVTNNKIANSTIVPSKLASDNAGTTGQVLTKNASGNFEWADDATGGSDPAVGGDVSGTISSITINDNTITSAMIKADVIVAQDLADNAIGIGELQDNAVISSKIAANAVNGTHIELGSDAAGDVMYYDGTNYVRLGKGTAGHVLTQGATAPAWATAPVSQNDIGAYPVGGDVSGTVSSITIPWSSIPANTITSAMIAPGVIVSQDIAANAVNGTHIELGSDAAGDVMYYDGTNYVRLPKGTAGHVLTMNTGATAPEWAADSTNMTMGGMLSGTVGNASIGNGMVTMTMLATTGTANGSKFLRDDGQWATPATVEVDPTAVTMAIALG